MVVSESGRTIDLTGVSLKARSPMVVTESGRSTAVIASQFRHAPCGMVVVPGGTTTRPSAGTGSHGTHGSVSSSSTAGIVGGRVGGAVGAIVGAHEAHPHSDVDGTYAVSLHAQPEKAPNPIEQLGRTTLANEEQPLNAFFAIVASESGRVTLASKMQKLNAFSSMVASECGKVILASEVAANADGSPI